MAKFSKGKISLKSFLREYKLEAKVLILGLILIIFILIGRSMYAHDDFYYPFKNTLTSLQTVLSFNDKDKAQVHLKNTKDLYVDFVRILQKDHYDQRLIPIAQEMGIEEGLAMKHMDLAKKSGINISPEVEDLCKGLEQQRTQLMFLVQITPDKDRPAVQKALNVTDQDLAKAMDW